MIKILMIIILIIFLLFLGLSLLSFILFKDCPRCSGTGIVWIINGFAEKTCPECNGSRRVSRF